ncbi:MAG: hypothetical protein RL385_1142 [Pseudomonadota bacterium]|jgi:hypothetical protein
MGEVRAVLPGIAAGLLLLGFGTPLRAFWGDERLPWWSPFAIWALSIALLAFAARTDVGSSDRP